MRILIILPDAHMHTIRLGPWVRSMREAPLTHTVLAALTPSHPDLELKLVDESVETLPPNEPADLVAISLLTGTASRGYEIARRFRSRGIAVVLGGVHVTILPGEAAQHADAIVVGRAEKAWPRLIEDFRRGRLERVYREEPHANGWLRDVPIPRRDLLPRWRYNAPNSIQATRGCRRACDFCTVPAVWPRFLRRPVADVLEDAAAIPGRWMAFNDVNLTDDPDYARELFTALIPLNKIWGGLATADVGDDLGLLDLMAESGCRYLLIGFESEDAPTLGQIRKGFNRRVSYLELVRALHERSIAVQGCFVFGFDHDTPDVFARTVQRVDELKIDIPRYSLYTPYPGTPLFERLMKEERILSYNWNDYDTMHVVIRPARMTPAELYSGFKWAYRESFRPRRILRRLRPAFPAAIMSLLGGLTYRIFSRRLEREDRFAEPYSIQAPGAPPPPQAWRIPEESSPRQNPREEIAT